MGTNGVGTQNSGVCFGVGAWPVRIFMSRDYLGTVQRTVSLALVLDVKRSYVRLV
jgi:hypothetical protein